MMDAFLTDEDSERRQSQGQGWVTGKREEGGGTEGMGEGVE